HAYKSGWYTNYEYIFKKQYVNTLVGHPLIFTNDGKSRIELVKGKPELRITRGKNGRMSLALSPEPSGAENYAMQETASRVKLIKLDDEYRAIAEILGKGISTPASARKKVLGVIEKFAGDITIVSDIGAGSEAMADIEADSRIHVQLSPMGNGLKLSLFVRPLGAGGHYYTPGAGGKNVIAEINAKQLQTTRDLSREKRLAENVVARCPTLRKAEENQGEWLVDEVHDCLELLLELDDPDQDIVLEWPEGKKFNLAGKAALNQFHLNIKRQKDWFAATGKVTVDDQLVLDLKRLLELTAKSQSRFMEIKDGEFIALTDEFRKRLRELDRYSERYGKGVRFHPLAAMALEGLTNKVGRLRTDKAWKSHIETLRGAENLEPETPSTLRAELRDYQTRGFHWLARLAHWGVGACLADDMGLGKTLQALAMLIKFAPDGPSLVIAPTSVCINWIAEAKRFAPTLNMIQFNSANRRKTLDGAGKFDVLVCGYGLLQQKKAAEMLASASWQMVVLDEAQAIKNVAAKRSRAAMKLQGAFKLITTGTPIENHLGELWNLFKFINPGLLGSLDAFNKNFATLIEKSNDGQARRHLKRLIQPFILRRTKNQVLEELPARTEIRLEVEMSKSEMAFYEALRQRALERLSKSGKARGGARHLKILSEIMKLRLACCNSALVDESIDLPSSKLAIFGDVLEDLLNNRHKALVFSQFVSHLTIIRSYLDEQNIHYQ
ncbi:MAG: DEAD/DEAH box helicase, partial [Desulfobacterales bacterium]|nr:DEAD/DEAH box helicase [Desulfobacterales bacterium]